MNYEIFSDTFLTDIEKSLTTFDALMDIFHKKKQFITFEKFNVYGKFPEDRPVKKVKGKNIYLYQGSQYGIISDLGHQKIVTSLKNAKLLIKVGKSEMSVNIHMVELIENIFKENSDIINYDVPFFVEPKPAPKSKRVSKRK